jgi:hypothetical protein
MESRRLSNLKTGRALDKSLRDGKKSNNVLKRLLRNKHARRNNALKRRLAANNGKSTKKRAHSKGKYLKLKRDHILHKKATKKPATTA